jgi:hypothetical protein
MFNHRFRECIRLGVAPELLHWASTPHGGKGGSPPPAPDYTGAAQAQAGASKENLTQQTWANRPEQITPWGRTSWGAASNIDPSTGQPVTQWTQTQTLDPRIQGSLNEQLDVQSGRSRLASGQMGRAGQALNQPFNWSGAPAAPGSMEQAQQEAYARTQKFQAPEREIARESMDQRLANQGITIGSKAYETEMRRQGDQEARQDQQNLQGSFAEGRAQGGYQGNVRQQYIAEEAQRRGIPINEMNALLTGQQVSSPQMPQFQSAGQAQAPNLLGAAQAQGQYGMSAYNAQQQGSNDLWGGVGQLAGTAASLYFSDERLKQNIKRVDTHPLGIGIYEYDAPWGHEIGVLAQEVVKVRPDLVKQHESGYLMVNYGGL